jgi:hypothetical protein
MNDECLVVVVVVGVVVMVVAVLVARAVADTNNVYQRGTPPTAHASKQSPQRSLTCSRMLFDSCRARCVSSSSSSMPASMIPLATGSSSTKLQMCACMLFV